MATRARELGFTWLALEYDDYGNAARWPEFREACLTKDVLPGAWFTNGWNIWQTPNDAGFVIGEVEGDVDRGGIEAYIPYLPDIPKAIITNNGGLIVKDSGGVTDIPASQEKSRKLREAGFAYIAELYLRTDSGQPTNKTWESMADIARNQLLFETVSPCFGLFGGAVLSDYEQWFDVSGWSAYLLEHLIG